MIEELGDVNTGLLQEDVIPTKAGMLKAIYSSRFRHQYSALYPSLREISVDSTKDVETLVTNLQLVQQYIESEHDKNQKEFDSLYVPLLKLLDHINLEVARAEVAEIDIRKVDSVEQKVAATQRAICEATRSLDTAKSNLAAAEEKLKEVNNKAENMITQVVSILSIFAAIVIGFALCFADIVAWFMRAYRVWIFNF